MEEYRMFLERVDKLVDRRQMATNIYLTVNTAVVGANSLVIMNTQGVEWQRQVAVLLLLGAGIVACDLWRRLIVQYRILLSWWFEQLRELEDALPESSKLLSKEYNELYLRQRGRTHIGLTRYEIWLPWLFTGIYIAFGIMIFILVFYS